jgi:hypothetical protein
MKTLNDYKKAFNSRMRIRDYKRPYGIPANDVAWQFIEQMAREMLEDLHPNEVLVGYYDSGDTMSYEEFIDKVKLILGETEKEEQNENTK